MLIQHDKSLDVALGNYTVYKHTSPCGKVYIGITRDSPQHRWKGGHGYVSNVHFFRAIQRYGWASFEHKILFTGLSESEAIQKERELIALFNSTDPTKGYNRDPGGGVRSEETVEKISKALTGVPLSRERRQRMSERRKGYRLSEETKEKLSRGHKTNTKVQTHIRALNAAGAGHAKTAEHRRKIAESQPRRRAVVNLDTGEVFASIQDAARSCLGSHANIVHACNGKRKTAYGYRWAYEGGGGHATNS